MNIKITNSDLPALFNAADTASLNAQTLYLRLFKFNLLSLALAAVISGVSQNSFTAWSTAIVLVISGMLTVALYIIHPEKEWYDGRAIAESVKMRTWQYIMGASHYGINSSEADQLFISDMKAILDDCKTDLTGQFSDGDQITAKMKKIRTLDIGSRKNIYLSERIHDQMKWYSRKARTNSSAAKCYFAIILVGQVLAIAAAFLMIQYPQAPFNPAAGFLAAAGGFMAWVQAKQYKQLSESYSVTATELGFIASLASGIDTELQLADFVVDSENAISREHTLWIAKRSSKRLPPMN